MWEKITLILQSYLINFHLFARVRAWNNYLINEVIISYKNKKIYQKKVKKPY